MLHPLWSADKTFEWKREEEEEEEGTNSIVAQKKSPRRGRKRAGRVIRERACLRTGYGVAPLA